MRMRKNHNMTQSEESITLNTILPSPLITVIDPSHSFRMTPYRIPSFRAEVRMLYEKTGRRLCDTERRIYYPE